MSTDYSNLSSQREAPQIHYLLNSKVMSFESSDLPMMMYLNPLSTVTSRPEMFPGNSLPGCDYVDGVSAQSKEEVLVFAPPGHHMFLEGSDREVDDATKLSDRNKVFAERLLLEENAELNLQHQPGLSLGLGNQNPSSIQMASYQNAFTTYALEKAEDFSFDLAMSSSNRFDIGSWHAPCPSISPKGINSSVKLQEDIVVGGMIYHSKYLKVVHELLDEFANVHQYLNQAKKHHNFQSFCQLESQKSAPVSSNELSPVSQNDLHDKIPKLLSMLEEVDRKYNQYYQQMQCVESSFEIVAGLGAARRYTALALWTISRQFRCLHDAIKKKIQSVQKTLGEHGAIPNVGVGLSRLRYLDQQMRQQRSLQQFGMVRQPWRPQRGLPETAVSVLRAWLFEHFLHPYPKDSEKILLARQTGLTRSQVANWFINARVRLWKPMIEDMYKEEFGEMGLDIQPSEEFEQAGIKPKESEDTGEELHESFTIKSADGSQKTRSGELRNSVNPDQEGTVYMAKLSNQNFFQEEEKMVFESNKLWRNQSNQNNNSSINAVSETFNFCV